MCVRTEKQPTATPMVIYFVFCYCTSDNTLLSCLAAIAGHSYL